MSDSVRKREYVTDGGECWCGSTTIDPDWHPDTVEEFPDPNINMFTGSVADLTGGNDNVSIPNTGLGTEDYQDISIWPEDEYSVAISKDVFGMWKQEIVYSNGARREITDLDALCRRIEALRRAEAQALDLATAWYPGNLRQQVEAAVRELGVGMAGSGGALAKNLACWPDERDSMRWIEVESFLARLDAIFGRRAALAIPEPEPEPATPPTAQVIDLMEALKAGLAQSPRGPNQ